MPKAVPRNLITYPNSCKAQPLCAVPRHVNDESAQIWGQQHWPSTGIRVLILTILMIVQKVANSSYEL